MAEVIPLIIESSTVPEMYLENNPYIVMKRTLTGGYTIIYIDERHIENVINNVENYATNVYPVVLGLLGREELIASGIAQVHSQPVLSLRGKGVLIGFVDTGIDYTLDTFRNEDGSTRIRYIWDQSIQGDMPYEEHYGAQYTEDDINAALRSDNPRAVLPHVDTVGHGTFLASIAAGRESGMHVGAAPECQIIMVKMRRATNFEYRRFLIPPDQENAFSAADFMMGVQYLIDRAHELDMPIAICVSVGTNKGGHDGGFHLEGYLTRVSGIIGTAVCAAAGNEAQAGHHTHTKLDNTGDTTDVGLKVGPRHEDIYISMWNSSADRLSVSIKSPTGEVINRVPARSGISYTQRLVFEHSTVTVEYVFPVELRGEQVTRIKILRATPGIWTITVYGDSILDGQFHLWLPLTGFIAPETTFLTPTPNYTIVLPATSSGVICCGAYNSANGSLSPTSSWGPSRRPAILPDFVAPGVNVSGIFPGGGQGNMSGTSVSAAITAGASALLLQWSIAERHDMSIDTYRLRADLISGCEREPGMDYPNNQWGYGKLNLYNTFRTLRYRET